MLTALVCAHVCPSMFLNEESVPSSPYFILMLVHIYNENYTTQVLSCPFLLI